MARDDPKSLLDRTARHAAENRSERSRYPIPPGREVSVTVAGFCCGAPAHKGSQHATKRVRQ
jgi:hypothetical protein